MRAYNAANQDRIREQRRANYWKNPESKRKQRRDWRAANLEWSREYDRNQCSKPEYVAQKAKYDKEYRQRLGEEYLQKQRERMRKNKTKYALQNQNYYQRNAEKIKQRAREWYEANKERVAEYSRSHYEANKERVLERTRFWAIANPEKIKAIRQNRRAMKRNAEGSHTAEDIQRQYKAQKGKCYYCGSKVNNTYHVDHVIPLSRGGSNWPENLVIACPHCNSSKQDKLPHEWIEGGRLL